MANYSLVINSQFRPYELSELMPIYQANAQMQANAENAYSELQSRADIWEKLANNSNDKASYNRYKEYSNKLHNAADNLLNQGINNSTRQDLMKLKSDYSSTIIPIEEAYTNRMKQAAIYQQASLQDPDLLVQFDPSNVSLDQYINNPTMKPNVYSGKSLANMAATAASKLANQLRDFQVTGNLDEFNKKVVQEYGLSAEDVDKWMNGDITSTNKVLTSIRNKVYNSSGINRWADANLLNRANNYIDIGMYSAIGQDKASAIEDYMAKAQLDTYYKSLQNNGNDTDYSLGSITHDEGFYDTNTENYGKLQKLQKSLYVNQGTGGLATNYSQNSKGKFINPMAVYELWQKQKVYEQYYNTENMSYEDIQRLDKNSKSSKTLSDFKKKYGIKNILTTEQYNLLKDLGYTSKSTRQDFNAGNFKNKINETQKMYSPSSTNLADYDDVSTKILSNINSHKNKLSNIVWDFNERKQGKNLTDIDNILTYNNEGAINSHITNVSYSIKYPDKLIITIDNKGKFLINPLMYNKEVANIINQAKDNLNKYKTNAEKSELQDEVTYKLGTMFNNYRKVRSKTDNKI